jgi:tetratricopeptide (TPR) repeat protein
MALDPAITLLLAQASAALASDPNGARALLEKAAALAPEHASAWLSLGGARDATGDLTGALAAWKRAQTLDPETLPAAYNVAMALQRMGRAEQALAAFEDLAARFPKAGVVWNTLGTLRLATGAVVSAEDAFQAAINIAPGDIRARANLAATKSYRGDTASALRILLEAFKAAPEDITIQVQLGNVLVQQGHHDTAEKMYRRALRAAPDHADALAGLAVTLERRGNAEAARALLDPVIAEGSRRENLLSAWALACQKTGHAERAIPVLASAVGPSMPAMARTTLGHVLGDLYVKNGDFELALNAHAAANVADARPFDPAKNGAWTDRVIAGATPAALAGLAQAAPAEGPRLVFIVGMPRSGTSLTEQVLGAHPAVHPAGEREELNRLVSSLVARLSPGATWADAARELGTDGMNNAAAWYRQRVFAEAGDATLVTDKMPLNYRYIGFMRQLFPDARVIHCRRDPLDTCLSCFFTNFNFSYAFTNQLDWLGQWYREYDRLMAAWEAAPPLPMHTSHYESLVGDLEGQARALLEFCGLEWDAACLNFHTSKRHVNTASYDQVRQPLYSTSIGRAQSYLPWLGPLVDALGAPAPAVTH